MCAPVGLGFELVGEVAAAGTGRVRGVMGGEGASTVDEVERVNNGSWRHAIDSSA